MKTFLTLIVLMAAANSYSADVKHTMATTKESMKQNMAPSHLDDLIRGEMSAVNVYNQVLEKATDGKETKELRTIRKDHENAVATLRRYANADVKEDTRTSGAWGTFAAAWTGTAKLMGNAAAIKALQEGEEHGVSEYKEALADKNISTDLKNLIKVNLLPKQEAHLKTLKTL
jgi:hypothetical protein